MSQSPERPDASSGGERRTVQQLRPGDRLDGDLFLVKQKELRTTNTGGLYLHLVLCDQTGEVVARMWEATQELSESIPDRGMVRVRGRVDTYKNRPQVIIDGVQAAPAEMEAADLLPATRYDVPAMWERLKEILRGVKDPGLRALCAQFINDEEFAGAFCKSPAARSNHHAFVGGLLEHTLNLLELALLVLPRYPQVHPDVVLTGIFLHDAGKTSELRADVGFDYTDDGQLVGHIVRSAIWVQERSARLVQEGKRPVDSALLQAVTHVILAHHGRYEYGSPRLPATLEAFLVHYLDNLDAKLNTALGAIERDREPQRPWTEWVPALESRIFKPDPTRRSLRSPGPTRAADGADLPAP